MARRGFTLIEVLIALVVLSVAIMGIAATTGRFLRTVGESDRQVAALQLVEDRIELIQMDPNYAALDTVYVTTEGSFPTLPGFVRTTALRRVGGAGQATDHKIITVTVTGPGLDRPVARTITVAAP